MSFFILPKRKCPVDYRWSMVIKQNTMKKKMPQASPRLLHGTQSHWFFKIQIFQMMDSSKSFPFSLGTISLAAAMRFAMVFSLSQVISGVSVRQAASGLLPPHQSRISICFHPTGIPKLIPAVLRGLKSDPQHLLDLDRSGIIKSKTIEEHKVKHWP